MGGMKALKSAASTTNENLLSPLDQIRQLETEIIRQVAAAHQDAERILADARQEAAQIKNLAKETGRQEGQTRYQEIVSKADRDARALVAQAQRRSDELSQKGERHMELAVRRVIEIILGQEDEGDDEH